MSFLFSSDDHCSVSWYGGSFNGKKTANGEIYNDSLLTAAHCSLPFGTMVELTNIKNNRKVTLRINDRGPYKMDKEGKAVYPLQPHYKRKFDLSRASFASLCDDDKVPGTKLCPGVMKVRYKILK